MTSMVEWMKVIFSGPAVHHAEAEPSAARLDGGRAAQLRNRRRRAAIIEITIAMVGSMSS